MVEAVVGGRFRTGSLLGSGSFGQVYAAIDDRTATPVALKVLGAASPRTALAEVRQLRACRHPNIVGYYDAGIDPTGPFAGRVWVALELAERSLADLLDQSGGILPTETVRQVAIDVARALAYLHGERQLLHRDVKPDNVLDMGSRWALSDLGLTAAAGGDQRGAEPYAAPEVLAGQPATERSDLWSFGILIARCLTGELGDPGVPPPMAEYPDDDLRALVGQLCARDPADRPPSAMAVLERLAPNRPGAAMPTVAPGDAGDLGIPGLVDAVLVGRTGTGSLYRAQEPDFARTVAVKVFPDAAMDEVDRVRFERERRAMGALSGHPNIVALHRSGFTTGGDPYLVMEYMAGGSLADRLRRDGPIPWPQAVEMMRKVADAVDTAHRAGVLHRDIRPGNILLSRYDEPALGNFGIARIRAHEAATATEVLGSSAHAAPELFEGNPPSGASDVYSLGSTLYALIAGHAPFADDDEDSVVPILTRVAGGEPPDLGRHGVPEPIWEVIRRALATDPAARPPTAGQFAAQLRAATEHVPARPAHTEPRPPAAAEPRPPIAAAELPPSPSPTTRRRRLPIALGVSLLAVAALLIAAAALGGGDEGGGEQGASTTSTSVATGAGSTSAPAAARPVVGECRAPASEDVTASSSDSRPPIPCSDPHGMETVAVVDLPSELRDLSREEVVARLGPGNSDAALAEFHLEQCLRPVASYLGFTGDEADAFIGLQGRYRGLSVDAAWFLPDPAQWDEGHRWVRCDAALWPRTVNPAATARSLRGAYRPVIDAGLRACALAGSDLEQVTRSLTLVPCDQPHNAEVVGASYVPAPIDARTVTSEEEWDRIIAANFGPQLAECETLVEATLGAVRTEFGSFVTYEDLAASRDRAGLTGTVRVTCYAWLPDGPDITGSIQGLGDAPLPTG